jgi:Ubiquitin carboxyl-terminal hydrolase
MTSEPRGIPNSSGVACHLTSALQLLIHAVPELGLGLLEIAKHDAGGGSMHTNTPSWMMELAHLVKCLVSEQDDIMDPTSFYHALTSATTLNPHKLGDAATALRVLLYTIQTTSSNNALEKLLHLSVTGGRLQQTMMGELVDKGKTIRRTKVKEIPMSSPFVVPGDCSTLSDALARVTVEPQFIQGLHWDHVSDYQDSIRKDLGCDEKEWTTTKTVRFASLPQHLLLHLQRFRYENDNVTLLSSDIDVPDQLDMTAYITDNTNTRSCCLQYQLQGAILHVSTNEEEETEGGHYVALVRTSDSHWFLLDDDTIMHMTDVKHVLDVCSGRPTEMMEEYTNNCCCATVLAYSRTCQCTNTFALLQELRQEQQSSLIGKRLRIRWKSGKYYSGVVVSYNDKSGKHRIDYDDGDVREYTLSKKTIQWIE